MGEKNRVTNSYTCPDAIRSLRGSEKRSQPALSSALRKERDEKKRGVRIGGRVTGGRRYRGRCPESEAIAQMHLRRARTNGQHRSTADADEQGTEEHGYTTCQGQSGHGAQDIAERYGGSGGLEEG